MKRLLSRIFFIATCWVAICVPSFGQGILVPSAGPVNQAMGGAGTAAPVDAIGSLYWNPATMSGHDGNELAFGMNLIIADASLSSSIPGLGAGVSGAEAGAFPVPSIGWLHKIQGTPYTIGFGLVGAGGFKLNYQSSLTNPVLAPQSNTPGIPGGLGRVASEAQFLQMLPMVSIALSERLSIGFGPTITMAQARIDPAVAIAPDDADGSGAARYPSGNGTRYNWGGGAQIGAYFITESCWHFGASLKSPQWMEDFRFFTESETGAPRIGKVKVDLPMVFSLGTAYSGIAHTVFAVDVRYYDYKNTDFFGAHGYNADGSLAGLGWSNMMSVATGVQYRASDMLTLRAGYSYNPSPFRDSETMFNIATPLQFDHTISGGLSIHLAPHVALNMAYSFMPDTTKTGPVILPGIGAIPGSSVTSKLQAHHAAFGIEVNY